MRRAFLLAAFLAPAWAQQAVRIDVDASVRQGLFRHVYSYFGYDEPNYTYTKNGQKLVGELAALTSVPVHVRAHHLLCSGDGTPSLKWGSTNLYTEDAQGNPVYDWTIIDKIFDTYVQAKAKPFVEIGFMPEALSTHPKPYKRVWPKPDDGVGWSYPPKDYAKWADVIKHWVQHSIDRYGRQEAATWYWELWNEPDISYWRGTPEEYNKLYDYTVAAIKKVLPTARVGGPATTGPANPKAAAFLEQFLEHCVRGTNAVTNKPGTQIDFITFHAKGSPKVADAHVQMGIAKNLRDIQKGFEIIAKFPELKRYPIILTESDPEGCAACSARTYPQNQYRNGTLYAAYTAAAMAKMSELAAKYQSNFEGFVTWAFEFEDQPYFDGFRTLATNGVDKPVLNFFRMAGLLEREKVKVESSGAVALETMLENGVVDASDVEAIATRSLRQMAILSWNYRDDETAGPATPVRLTVRGLPLDISRVLVHHYRIDESHSNAFAAWKQMGSPQQPTPEQFRQLEAAGQLQLLDSPRWLVAANGAAALDYDLPRQALSLIRLGW